MTSEVEFFFLGGPLHHQFRNMILFVWWRVQVCRRGLLINDKVMILLEKNERTLRGQVCFIVKSDDYFFLSRELCGGRMETCARTCH